MNVGHFLSASAEHHPDRPAVIWGDRTIRYAEADRRANALATALRERGLMPGERVGILMWNRPELLESMFATWKAGGCVVPLNARFVAGEIAYHLSDPKASVVIFDEGFREVMARLSDQLPSVRQFICAGEPLDGQVGYEELVTEYLDAGRLYVTVTDEDLAWLFYTSGTTGRPKGAMLTHGNLTFVSLGWVVDLMHLELEDVGLHAAPLTHGAGFHALALTLKAASQVILKPHQFDPANVLGTITRHRVTNTWLVPTQIKLLLNYPDLGRFDLSSLKWIVYGGSPMYVEDLKDALQRIGRVFVQIFGQGETPMTATYLRPAEHVVEGPLSRRLASCGHARSGVEVRILDHDDREVPRREPGEICVRGPSVMEGYWERPEATKETLRGGWLRTGDIASMDEEGYVFILDRTKDMIISGGANIYPREVEEVLLEHPAVSEVCVIGVPDSVWGEAVKAVVVLKPGASATEQSIVAFAVQHMASYKKPKSVDFVDELPKSAYGKLLKRELRARYWAGQERGVY